MVGRKLIHSLTIERPTFDEDNPDERGQPAATYTVLAEIRGLVQPKTARELALISDAGLALADVTIHILPRDLEASDRIIRDAAYSAGSLVAGTVYEIAGIRRFDYGRLRHLEIDARTIESPSGA